MKNVQIIALVLIALGAMMVIADEPEGTKHEFDKKGFTKIAKQTIGRVLKDDIDADKMLLDMEKLVDLGIAGCQEHMGEAETPENEKKMMQLIIDYATNTNVVQKDGKPVLKEDGKYIRKMTQLSLSEIEKQWHEGGIAKKEGIDFDKFDHFSEVLCHFDTVVHPATCVICLNEYKKAEEDSRKEELMEQVKNELKEVIEHLKHLE
ncbi:MAG: hypothetical protein JW860_10025 [Sedimentisphaerales bacterium]|nr:hypothetical protein [Sedimentisphaerales bacterium]